MQPNYDYTHRAIVEKFKHNAVDQSGFVSDDDTWSDEFLIKEFLDLRTLLTKQYLAAGKSCSTKMVQTLGCVKVTEEDRSTCPCSIPSGCYWLKSEKPIPSFIKILSVTSTIVHGDMLRFSPIGWDKLQYIPNSRSNFAKKGKYWTTRDTGNGTFLYLYGDRDLQEIQVTGIFENPMEVAVYPSCGLVDKKALCNPLDVDFHTDRELVTQILDSAYQRLIAVRSSAKEDVKNNDSSRI
jgi:hypothetical protein